MTARSMPLDDHLCFALYSAHQAMGAVYKPLLDPLGLTYPQYLVLLALWQQDDQTVGQIGAQLGLSSNTLTPLLKRMETAGHLTRTRSAVDERQVRLTLTHAGSTLQDNAQHITGCIFDATGLDAATVIDLQHRIRDLRDRLAQRAN
jgi:MarR family transcriptional regulator, organic hydroperoxide resistance regulator